MSAAVATLVLMLSCASRARDGHDRNAKARSWSWLRGTYSKLRNSGVLDSAAELREAELFRQLLQGRLDRAAYQRAMTELADTMHMTPESLL